MRWILFLLVYANLGYLAWGFFQESQQGYRTPAQRPIVVSETGQRLILLAEQTETPKKNIEEPAIQPVEVSPSLSKNTDEPKQCLTLGPFAGPNRVDRVRQQLFAWGVDSQEHASQNREAADYWVHIPPLSSRGAAIRMLRELQAQQFDSFVITQGELTNGISLGLFSKYDSAQTVRGRLLAAGYTVDIKTLYRYPEAWWLELESEAMAKLDDGLWEELQKREPDIKKTKKLCEGIATHTEFL